MSDLAPTLDILKTLVGFDTTSRRSNLALIDWVEAYLDGHGVPHRRVPNADGSKSNLIATIGPAIEGGAVLSGHTDVVPVDGQPWATDPFDLTVEHDGRLYGRGTCDMKGFLALALGAVPGLIAARPRKPVHLAFSYDEEIGCLGAPPMIEVIRRELPAPAFVVVGEPTDMVAVSGHKGISYFRVTVTGREAHSSQTQLGVSAIMEAVPLMASLTDARRAAGARGRPRLALHAQGRDADHRPGQRRHGRQHPGPRVQLPLRPALSAGPRSAGRCWRPSSPRSRRSTPR